MCDKQHFSEDIKIRMPIVVRDGAIGEGPILVPLGRGLFCGLTSFCSLQNVTIDGQDIVLGTIALGTSEY